MSRQGGQPVRTMSGFGNQPTRSGAQMSSGRIQIGKLGGTQTGWPFGGMQNGAPGLPASPNGRTPLSGASFAQSLGAGAQTNTPLDPSDFPSLSGNSPSLFSSSSTQAVWSAQRSHGVPGPRSGVAHHQREMGGIQQASHSSNALPSGHTLGGFSALNASGEEGASTGAGSGEQPPAIDDFPPLGGLATGDMTHDRRIDLMQNSANGILGDPLSSKQERGDENLDPLGSPLADSRTLPTDNGTQADVDFLHHPAGRDPLMNQYGLPDLVDRIRSRNPDVASLSIGHDLTQLGLDLSSNESLWPSWGGAFATQPARPLTPDYSLPNCYKVGNVRPLQDKISNFNTETLFIIFYQMPGDIAQEYAAYELTHRNWRFHKVRKIWFSRGPTCPEPLPMADGERGRYDIFNFPFMRRETVDMYVKWIDIDDHITPAGPIAPVIQ